MTLEYSLCKKLSDAGFPQDSERGLYRAKKGEAMSHPLAMALSLINGWGEDVLYCPTLSELIDACEKAIEENWNSNGDWDLTFQLYGAKDDWHAGTHEGYIDCQSGPGEIGKTPEEAVAHLWLAIQAKQSN